VNFRGTNHWAGTFGGRSAERGAASWRRSTFPINDPKVSGTWSSASAVWRTTTTGLSGVPRTARNDSAAISRGSAVTGSHSARGRRPDNRTRSRQGHGYVVPRSARRATGTHCGLPRGAGAASSRGTPTRRRPAWRSAIDTSAQPRRFVSGIAIDPDNRITRTFRSRGITPTRRRAPGHVFEVQFQRHRVGGWKDLSFDLGDQPITDVAFDPTTGSLSQRPTRAF